ncbi:protein-glutamine gamma-glutamyltransferase E-like [Channa argus]|uniref:protein-glutamine gamma-glutamyltransferase E-like n=1 Tax=Channa argus TaxID=215402 RepID=UPI0029456EB1|nr:hypothetical protein Q8A73_006127 [Channa argus]
MTTNLKKSIFKGVELNSKNNNTEHHTSVISVDELIVRRGQRFTVSLKLTQAFNPDLNPLTVVAATGTSPSEDRGTKSRFGIPDNVMRSPSAKAIWNIELHKNSFPSMGILILTITPAANTPVGQYVLSVKHQDQEMLLAKLVVLFNPWCPDDWVFLPDEKERQEYVMNEQGIIYRGSRNYISPMNWDFGQFEDSMVNICLKMLDVNNKFLKDPASDESARCNPIYISRVVSAMINCNDDRGVLQGNWGSSYAGGVSPSQWNGSYAILKQWFKTNCSPVKYGQCWVFAGVMCSVMRLLGIPCRVVTNFDSAHDNDANLTIDVYHADYGVRERESKDSIWNFHVWVEGWMKRPDLAGDGKYDGWQVLDPTPQEKSEGVFCCGPASVKAILNGETDLKYDVPFVFAEVNADCVDWLVKANGSKVIISSDTKRVGKNISTKAVDSNKRMDITDSYKYAEGSEKERDVFNYASGNNSFLRTARVNALSDMEFKPLSMRFEEVTKPINGKDVHLNLVLQSTTAKQLSINIGVQALTYNGKVADNIQGERKEETLQPGKDLSIPIRVPFSVYNKYMMECDSMRVSALVAEKPGTEYLVMNNVVLQNPPISIKVSGEMRLNREINVEVAFMNPIDEKLKDCTLTVSGSGLMEEQKHTLPDLLPNTRARVLFALVPYKIGEKTLIADISCSSFKNIKTSCTVNVRP